KSWISVRAPSTSISNRFTPSSASRTAPPPPPWQSGQSAFADGLHQALRRAVCRLPRTTDISALRCAFHNLSLCDSKKARAHRRSVINLFRGFRASHTHGPQLIGPQLNGTPVERVGL